MHEYVLYSHIPPARENQVLSILAGITGTQPVPICEQTLIFAQTKVPETAISKKSPKQQQPKNAPGLSYHKLLRDIQFNGDTIAETGSWRFRAEHVPEPGVPTFISRVVTEHLATDEHKARFKDASWYRFQQQFTVMGNRFVLGNVIVRLVRFYVPMAATSVDAIDGQPIPHSDMKLLDQSGSWIVESVVRVEDTSVSDVMDKAREELSRFQSRMDGAVDLYPPDRLALDTRVRNT